MEEVYISGLENNLIYMKDNLSKEREMEEEHFGGLTEAGMKGNLEMEFKVVTVSCIEMEGILSMKVLGIMVCLMVKVLNSLRMEKNIKDHLKKISSMEMVYSIKMIQ